MTNNSEDRLRMPLVPVLFLAMGAGMLAQVSALPAGWTQVGTRLNNYAMLIDSRSGRTGGAVCIKSHLESSDPTAWGGTMESFRLTGHRGKRLRFSAYVKSVGTTGWAGLWLRVDGPDHKTLAFDNMLDRPIAGTREWARYEVVLDVAADSAVINFGMLLTGKGEVWLDDLTFEVLSGGGPAPKVEAFTPAGLTNLDFNQS